ncbi:hypothetical protein FS837_001440 [Tulasnella sp. UAMH 9824]|nr:hypothetical protein FS837_001440 [Tulasnella sp. UAMH 9824]
MFPRSTHAPAVNYAKLSTRITETPNSDITSLVINGVDEETLTASKRPANEQYSIVQPGVILTQIQPELDGELSIPEKPILKGGYADIYKGTWTSPDGIKVDVAIKTLRTATPASITTDTTKLKGIIDIRMKRETLIWKRANHRNVHTFLGFRLAYEPQLISPWCSNGNLSDYLVFNPQLSTFNKLKLVHQSALGLEFLHGRNPPICHGDIKPQNVLINDACEAALSDFGLSRVIEGWEIRTGLTTSGGGLKATNAYTAPELFTAEKPKPSLEADIYAFGGLILAVSL